MSSSLYNDNAKFGAISLETQISTQGLDLCNQIMRGELPAPTMWRTLNVMMMEAEDGRVVFKGKPMEEHYNPSGVVHGGWAGGILDSALGCCVWTKVPLGLAYTTAEFKVNLIRPITEQSGEVFAEGKVIHVGRKLAISEASLKTAEGKLLAHGTETCAIFDPVSR
ncbi:MAG: PaaI family thioesterase [Pseudomonadota bacterium]